MGRALGLSPELFPSLDFPMMKAQEHQKEVPARAHCTTKITLRRAPRTQDTGSRGSPRWEGSAPLLQGQPPISTITKQQEKEGRS